MEYMRQMNQMFQTPFGFGSGGLLAVEAPRQQQAQQIQQAHRQQLQLQQQPQMQLATNNLFNFGGFGGMFQNMRGMMDDMHNTFVSTMLQSKVLKSEYSQSHAVLKNRILLIFIILNYMI